MQLILLPLLSATRILESLHHDLENILFAWFSVVSNVTSNSIVMKMQINKSTATVIFVLKSNYREVSNLKTDFWH